ncbi:Imm50 family immunity protein [Citrobacter portucalensis]|uniref:Imm50 family immunity protein n=1 Tax=Citrobacter portucalensis TaxID=1639133 RepID=UPI00226BB1B8|nr:Imm50 family immunity protein [Citrobacter portucalensis]MCX8985776.1 immunity 50 family protein [Citrobacter portucalensis]
MYWNDIDGSVLFNKVFTKYIEVNEIDIFDIKIDREAATVLITFDLVNELPDNPPPKWVKGYNRCRCGINCSRVKYLKIDGMSIDMLAKIEIDTNNNEVLVKGTDIFLNLKCSHIQLMGPSVYISQ